MIFPYLCANYYEWMRRCEKGKELNDREEGQGETHSYLH